MSFPHAQPQRVPPANRGDSPTGHHHQSAFGSFRPQLHDPPTITDTATSETAAATGANATDIIHANVKKKGLLRGCGDADGGGGGRSVARDARTCTKGRGAPISAAMRQKQQPSTFATGDATPTASSRSSPPLPFTFLPPPPPRRGSSRTAIVVLLLAFVVLLSILVFWGSATNIAAVAPLVNTGSMKGGRDGLAERGSPRKGAGAEGVVGSATASSEDKKERAADEKEESCPASYTHLHTGSSSSSSSTSPQHDGSSWSDLVDGQFFVSIRRGLSSLLSPPPSSSASSSVGGAPSMTLPSSSSLEDALLGCLADARRHYNHHYHHHHSPLSFASNTKNKNNNNHVNNTINNKASNNNKHQRDAEDGGGALMMLMGDAVLDGGGQNTEWGPLSLAPLFRSSRAVADALATPSSSSSLNCIEFSKRFGTVRGRRGELSSIHVEGEGRRKGNANANAAVDGGGDDGGGGDSAAIEVIHALLKASLRNAEKLFPARRGASRGSEEGTLSSVDRASSPPSTSPSSFPQASEGEVVPSLIRRAFFDALSSSQKGGNVDERSSTRSGATLPLPPSGSRRRLIWGGADGGAHKTPPNGGGMHSAVYAIPTLPHPSCIAEELIRALGPQAPPPPVDARGSASSSNRFTNTNDAPMPPDVDLFYKYPNAKLQCYKHGGHAPGVPRRGYSPTLAPSSSSRRRRHGGVGGGSPAVADDSITADTDHHHHHRHLLLENVVYFKGELYLLKEGKRGSRGGDGGGEASASSSSSAAQPTVELFNYSPTFSMIKGNWPQPIFGNLSAKVLTLVPPLTAADDADGGPTSVRMGASAIEQLVASVLRPSSSSSSSSSSPPITFAPLAYWQPPTDFSSHYHTLVELTMPAFTAVMAHMEEEEGVVRRGGAACTAKHRQRPPSTGAFNDEKLSADHNAFVGGDDSAAAVGAVSALSSPLSALAYWCPKALVPPYARSWFGPSLPSRPSSSSTSSSSTAEEASHHHHHHRHRHRQSLSLSQPSALLSPPSLMLTSRPRRVGHVKNFAALGGPSPSSAGKAMNAAKTCRYAPASVAGGGAEASVLSSAPGASLLNRSTAAAVAMSVAADYALRSPATALWSVASKQAFLESIAGTVGGGGADALLTISSSSSSSSDSCLDTMLGKMTTAVVGGGGGGAGAAVYGLDVGHSQFADPLNVGAGMGGIGHGGGSSGGGKGGGDATAAEVERAAWSYEGSKAAESNSASAISSSHPPSPLPSFASDEAFFIKSLLVGNPTHCEPLWGPDPFYAEALAHDQHLRGTRYTRRLFRRRREGDAVGRHDTEADSAVSPSSSSAGARSSLPPLLPADLAPMLAQFINSYNDCQRHMWSFRNYYLQSVVPIGDVSVSRHSSSSSSSSPSSSAPALAISDDAVLAKLLEGLVGAKEEKRGTATKAKKSRRDKTDSHSTAGGASAPMVFADTSSSSSSSLHSSAFLMPRLLGSSSSSVLPSSPSSSSASSLIPPIFDAPIDYIGGGASGSGGSSSSGQPINILFTSRKGDWARQITNEDEVVASLRSYLRARGEAMLRQEEGGEKAGAQRQRRGHTDSGEGAAEDNGGDSSSSSPSSFDYASRLSPSQRRIIGRKLMDATVRVIKFTDKMGLEHQLITKGQLDVNATSVFVGNHGANYIPSVFLRPNAAVVTMSFATPGFYPFAVFPRWLHWRDLVIEQDCNKRLGGGKGKKCRWSSGNNNDNIVSKPHQMGRLMELVEDAIVEQVVSPRRHHGG